MTVSGLSELSVRQLLARRRRLAGGVADPEGTLRGVLLQPRAGGARARGVAAGAASCTARTRIWRSTSDGRSRTIYVPARRSRRPCEEHVALTQRNEALLAEISQINLELLRRRALG